METLLVTVCFGLIAAIIAVICIAVNTAATNSKLDETIEMIKTAIVPALVNLEKISGQLDRSAPPGEPGPLAEPETQEAPASTENAALYAETESPVRSEAVKAEIKDCVPTSMAAEAAPISHQGDAPGPEADRPLESPALETGPAEEMGPAEPSADPFGPQPEVPPKAAINPYQVPVGPPKPSKPSEPTEPSALSKAFEQVVANVAPILKSLWRQGTNFLMKEGHIWVVAGVLVLLLGVSFFVRYSIAMGWFSPPLRLAASSLLGLIIFAFGFRLRQSRRGYGLLLQSCGLGVMYLTTVGAVRLYGLLDSISATAILTILVALTAVMALWQNAQLLAHVSIIAAFAAPLLVSENSGNYIGLFSFYSIINTGILAMSFFRPWRRLYLTGFVLTFGIFTAWAASSYQAEFFSTSAPFLVAFYAFYALMGLRVTTEPVPGPSGESVSLRRRLMSTDLTLTILTPLVFLLLAAYIGWKKPYFMALCAFGLGVIYVVSTRFVLKSQRDQATRIARLLVSQGLLYANLALPLTFLTFKPEMFRPGWLLGLIWSLEGAFIYRSAARDGQAIGRIFGLALIVLAAALGLHTIVTAEIARPLMSPTFLLTLLITAGALAAADSGLEDNRNLLAFEKNWPRLIIGLAMIWLIGATALEVFMAQAPRGFRDKMAWLTIALGLEVLLIEALRKFRPQLATQALWPAAEGTPALAWPAVAITFTAGVLSFFYLKAYLAGKYIQAVYPALAPVEWAAWLIFLAAAAVGLDPLKKLGRPDERLLEQVQPPPWRGFLQTVGGAALVLALGRLGAGFSPLGHKWTYFWLMLPAVAALAALTLKAGKPGPMKRSGGPWLAAILSALCLWNFFAFIRLEGYQPYIPLNPIDLIQAATAVAPGLWLYFHLKREESAAKILHSVFYVLGLLLLVWLNVVIGRFIHHWLGTPYGFRSLWANDSFHTLAALSWAVVGIASMISGHRAARRPQWLMGAALIVADVLKLFFVDLSQADTITRVVSFVCVGVLLILVGYFAPLPPKSEASVLKEKAQ